MTSNATADRVTVERRTAGSSPPESPHGEHIILLITFHLTPDQYHVWHGCWKEVAQLAAQEPGCVGFRLMVDSRSPERRIMLSEWESHSALARFWRSAPAVWLEDALGYAHMPMEITIADPLDATGETL